MDLKVLMICSVSSLTVTNISLWGDISVILFVTPTVLLFIPLALFAEPRIGKVQAKRLEEDTKSCRNRRHIYPLLAGTAAITASLLADAAAVAGATT